MSKKIHSQDLASSVDMSNGDIYCYIDLSQTNYKPPLDYELLPKDTDPAPLLEIYRQYCIYKKFASVWPIYAEEFSNPSNDIIGYYDKGKLVAFSMIRILSSTAVEAEQFAWTYHNPKLALGIKVMKCECAIYKARGYKILILGEAHEYKKQIDGFKLFGPRLP